MSEHEPIPEGYHYRSELDPLPVLACARCAALVAADDHEEHNAWHARLNRALGMRPL